MPAIGSLLVGEFFADPRLGTFSRAPSSTPGSGKRLPKMIFHDKFVRACGQGELVRVSIEVYVPGFNHVKIERANGETAVAMVLILTDVKVTKADFAVDKNDNAFHNSSCMFRCTYSDECEQGELVSVVVFAYGPGFNLVKFTRANGDTATANNVQMLPPPPGEQ